eukprot:Nk52_evm46s255 gene=Nk52_evmTU46s255
MQGTGDEIRNQSENETACRESGKSTGEGLLSDGKCSATADKAKKDKHSTVDVGVCRSSENSAPDSKKVSGADDVRENDVSELLKKESCSNVENKYVNDVYNVIAKHFSDTRYKAWPLVQKFVEDMPPGSLWADVGCGNGKYLFLNNKLSYAIGSDKSEGLVSVCGERKFEVMVCDNLCLPYRSGCFDFVISIAVIHHFSSPERRLNAIKEMTRLLRPGGKILIFVWAFEQKGKHQYDKQDVFVPWHFQKKYTGEKDKRNKDEKKKTKKRSKKKRSSEVESPTIQGNNVLDYEERETPNSKTEENLSPAISSEATAGGTEKHSNKTIDDPNIARTYQRYYHMFKSGELTDLVESDGSCDVLIEDFDHQNWYVIAQKNHAKT